MNFFSQLTNVSALILLLLPLGLSAKVKAPNYDFSLDSLQVFMPGAKLEDIQTKFKKAVKLQKTDKGVSLYKVYVEQIRYKFPVFFQTKESVIIDFYARLPAYFLHDIFHQSIINRFGKQDKYFKKEEAAVYIWNKKKNTYVYSGGCTITCFPIYYTVYSNEMKASPLFKTLD